DEAVEPGELLRKPHLDRFGAEPPQHGCVLPEVPLHGEDADPERLLHASMVTSAIRARSAVAGRAWRPFCGGPAGRVPRGRSRGARGRAPAPRGCWVRATCRSSLQ